jgi:glutathione S-transferase
VTSSSKKRLFIFHGFDAASKFKKTVSHYSPTGTVPFLIDHVAKTQNGPLVIWDTLAIAEYIAEISTAPLWPEDPVHRARMRSICAEMHSSFGNLRGLCPMNIGPDLSDAGKLLWRDNPALVSDVERIDALWQDALEMTGGPFLGGAFGIADTIFAPVVMRLEYYGLPVSDTARAYMDRVIAHPAVADWIKEAKDEVVFIDFEEPYRLEP